MIVRKFLCEQIEAEREGLRGKGRAAGTEGEMKESEI